MFESPDLGFVSVSADLKGLFRQHGGQFHFFDSTHNNSVYHLTNNDVTTPWRLTEKSSSSTSRARTARRGHSTPGEVSLLHPVLGATAASANPNPTTSVARMLLHYKGLDYKTEWVPLRPIPSPTSHLSNLLLQLEYPEIRPRLEGQYVSPPTPLQSPPSPKMNPSTSMLR